MPCTVVNLDYDDFAAIIIIIIQEIVHIIYIYSKTRHMNMKKVLQQIWGLFAWHSGRTLVLAGELFLSCARSVADGWPLMWVNLLQ